MSDSRERFEAWYAGPAYPMTRPIGWHTNGFRMNHGEYWVGEIQEEWLTWQAGRTDGVAETARAAVDTVNCYSLVGDRSKEMIVAIRAEFPEAWK